MSSHIWSCHTLALKLWCAICIIFSTNASSVEDEVYPHDWYVRVDLEDLGSLQGIRTRWVDFFGGIPYAAPPVGKRRWAPPEEPKPWTPHLLDASHFGPDCHQVPDPVMNPRSDTEGMSEDCLYLNVYTPIGASSDTGKLPVMVWFHGGAFQQGAAKRPEYDGRRLAQENNVVVVTANYRLGALGFLVISELGLLGNYGLMDQRAVLYWVKRHIPSFGGDLDSITLFGESAGAVMIGNHLLMENPGLFHRAILQSNPLGYQFRSPTVADFLGDALRRAVDCRDLACLREEPISEIIRAQSSLMGIPRSVGDFFAWGPTLTGDRNMPFDRNQDESDFLQAVRARMEASATKFPVNVTQPFGNLDRIPDEIPIIVGTNKHEGEMFVHSAFPITMSKAVYWMFVGALFKDSASRVLKHYRSYVRELEQEAALISEKQVKEELYRQYFEEFPNEQFDELEQHLSNSTAAETDNAKQVVSADTVEKLLKTFSSGGASTPSNTSRFSKWIPRFKSLFPPEDIEVAERKRHQRQQINEERRRQKSLKEAGKVTVDYRPVMSRIINDYLFRCSSWHFAHELSRNRVGRNQTNNVYVFRFSQPTHVPGYKECWGKSCHTAELPYVFKAMETIRSNYSTLSEIAQQEAPEAPQYPYTEMFASMTRRGVSELDGGAAGDYETAIDEEAPPNRTSFQRIVNHFFGDYFRQDADDAIATDMSRRWVAFARTGDPNYEGSKVEWAPWRYIAQDAGKSDEEFWVDLQKDDVPMNSLDKRESWLEHFSGTSPGENGSSSDLLDAGLEKVLRQKALQALNMEVAEESEMISELRRTKGSKQDPENPFVSFKVLSNFGMSRGSSDDQLDIEGLPRGVIRQIQRIAQEIGVLGTGLDRGTTRGKTDKGAYTSDEDFFPQLLELMWPPEGKLIERDCTCDFWDRKRCK